MAWSPTSRQPRRQCAPRPRSCTDAPLVAAESEPLPAVAGGRVRFGDSNRHYDLPETDVVLLPVGNTTTEAIANYLLDQVLAGLDPSPLTYAELTLAESPGVAATVRKQLR
jgi:hypothetical protein